jgi:hypothetical protein
MRYTIIFLLFSCLIFLGCAKKYPEDHIRYFALEETPKDRINTNWLITKYFINNVDSTNFLNNQLGKATLNMNCNSNSGNYSIDIKSGAYNIGTAGFSFTQKNNVLFINGVEMYESSGITPNQIVFWYNPFIEKNTNWKILELTNINLKITCLINGVNYEIDCSQQ